MARRDKHGRTADDYRAEAKIIGAKLPAGATPAQMRKSILEQGARNRKHNTEILRTGHKGRWATGGDSCQCH